MIVNTNNSESDEGIIKLELSYNNINKLIANLKEEADKLINSYLPKKPTNIKIFLNKKAFTDFEKLIKFTNLTHPELSSFLFDDKDVIKSYKATKPKKYKAELPNFEYLNKIAVTMNEKGNFYNEFILILQAVKCVLYIFEISDSIDGDTKNAAQRELMIRVNKVTTIPNYEKAKELADDFQSKMKKKKREKNDIFPIFFDEKDKGNFTKNFNFIMKKEDTSGKVGITIKKILQAFSEDDDESWWWNRLDQFHSDSLIERIVTGATWKLFDFTYIKVDDIAKYKCLACSEEFYLSSESRNHMRERKCEGWEDKAKEISSRYDAVAFMSLLDEMTPRPEDRRCDLYIHLDPRKLNTASPQKNVIYVGETGDFIYRMSQHADEYYTAVKRKNIDGDKVKKYHEISTNQMKIIILKVTYSSKEKAKNFEYILIEYFKKHFKKQLCNAVAGIPSSDIIYFMNEKLNKEVGDLILKGFFSQMNE